MKTGLAWLAWVRKALYAVVIAVTPLLVGMLNKKSPGEMSLTKGELAFLIGTGLTAFLGVYNATNGPKPGTTTVTVDTAPGPVAEGDAKLTQPRVDQ